MDEFEFGFTVKMTRADISIKFEVGTLVSRILRSMIDSDL